MDNIELLVTLDENYIPPLQVLLTSIHATNPGEPITLYLMHSGIPAEKLSSVEALCALYGIELRPVPVGSELFEDAPVTKQYPQEMYYRLLTPHLLPGDVHRVLYLDPDTLVINPLRPLWETELDGNVFAAASHKGKTELVSGINQVRLGTESKYFNSGVLLIDLDAARREVKSEEIFDFVEHHGRELVLPDQDVLNALYGERTLELDDAVWNYDARNFNTYLLRSGGDCDLDWVLGHTAILHFCGKTKPWQPGYLHRFGVLYKHYIQLTRLTGLYAGE